MSSPSSDSSPSEYYSPLPENDFERAATIRPVSSNPKIDDIQALLDQERALIIKLEPLPFATSLDQLHEFALSLSDPSYRLPTPDWVDSAQGTMGFFGYALKHPHRDDELLSALFPALGALNKLQDNILDLDRLQAIGIHSGKSFSSPLRWSIIGSGYVSESILGLVSPWKTKPEKISPASEKQKSMIRCRELENGKTFNNNGEDREIVKNQKRKREEDMKLEQWKSIQKGLENDLKSHEEKGKLKKAAKIMYEKTRAKKK